MNKMEIEDLYEWLNEETNNVKPINEQPIKLDWEQYEVMAYHKNKNGVLETLFTYDDFETLEKAKKQIKIWKEDYGYNILFWYINGYDLEHKGLKGYYKLVKWGN